jgi:hypothetical protein
MAKITQFTEIINTGNDIYMAKIVTFYRNTEGTL